MKLMKRDPTQKGIDDAVELFEQAHYIVPSHDAETGDTEYRHAAAPSFRSVRRLKQRRADYKPGPVKVYTTEEIEDYVRSKAVLSDDG